MGENIVLIEKNWSPGSAGMAWIKWRFQNFGPNKMALNSRENALKITTPAPNATFFFLFHALWPNKKWYIPELWYTYSPRLYLKHFFCLFQKSEKLQSGGFSAYLLDCLVFVKLQFLYIRYSKWSQKDLIPACYIILNFLRTKYFKSHFL